MMQRNKCPRQGKHPRPGMGIGKAATAALLLAVFPAAMQAQAGDATAAPQSSQAGPSSAAHPGTAKNDKQPTAAARRQATRLYLAASKLYLDGKFEAALAEYEQAAQLDPDNANYGMAGDVRPAATP